jgi:hypothetical protein
MAPQIYSIVLVGPQSLHSYFFLVGNLHSSMRVFSTSRTSFY